MGIFPTTALPVSGQWVYSQQAQTGKHPLTSALEVGAKVIHSCQTTKEKAVNAINSSTCLLVHLFTLQLKQL